jgi:hypothetical protein
LPGCSIEQVDRIALELTERPNVGGKVGRRILTKICTEFDDHTMVQAAINRCRRLSPDCSQNCPCQLPRPGFGSQQQPKRSIEEVVETP